MRRLCRGILVLALLVGLGPSGSSSTAAGQTHAYDGRGGAHIRVAGDVTIGEGEESDFVLVVGGNASIAGTAGVLVVIDGEALIRGGRVNHLIVIDGAADLSDSALVAGDVTLIDGELSRDETSRITGSIDEDAADWLGVGAAVLGISFALGFGILLILFGLGVAALIPSPVRRGGRALTDRVAAVLASAAVVWIGLPVLAVGSIITIIGLPLGLTIFFLVLPVLGFLGYLLTAVRVGDEILLRTRGSVEPEHPYLAVIVGVLVLLLVSFVPVLGGVVGPIASLLGAGALALIVWDSLRSGGSRSHAPAAE